MSMIKFRRGCTYRHNTSGTLDIYVVAVSYYDNKRSRLKIRWISKSSGKIVSFPGDRADGITNIEINSKDYEYWKQI